MKPDPAMVAWLTLSSVRLRAPPAFGTSAANHPVADLRTGAVSITSQNHGFAVDPDSLPEGSEPTHRNLNDGTLEGMVHRRLPILSCQYHPEASPGPHDSRPWFRSFAAAVAARRREPVGAAAGVAASGSLTRATPARQARARAGAARKRM